MSPELSTKLARRVVTGVSSTGRSTIVADGDVPAWTTRPTGVVVMDVWSVASAPPSIDDESAPIGELIPPPAGAGVAVRIAVFPPERGIDASSVEAYEAAMNDLYGDQGDAPSDVPGMHRTETVDVATVIEGEIWVVLEEGETLLRAGDCLVQRGTRHAWRNRSGRPCTLVSTMLAGLRS
jgi:mannose-6-phosphate isomerase-like protein (cupin superfamily)